jgi:hypothetical protein
MSTPPSSSSSVFYSTSTDEIEPSSPPFPLPQVKSEWKGREAVHGRALYKIRGFLSIKVKKILELSEIPIPIPRE